MREWYCSCNTAISLVIFLPFDPKFFSLALSIKCIYLYLATKEAAWGVIFHSTMHLTSIRAAGTQQFRKADLCFSVYRCISKLDFRHVNLKMFDLKSFSSFSLLPVLSGRYCNRSPHYPFAAAISKCQFPANEFSNLPIFFFYDGYLKMTKIINLPGLSLRVYIQFVDETTSQFSWRGTAGFEEAKGFW